jgi:GAF domain-containing protein
MSELCVRACETSDWWGEALAFMLVAGRALWNERQKRVLRESEAAAQERERAAERKATRLISEKEGLQATVQALTQRPAALRVQSLPIVDGLPPSPRPSTATQTDETHVLFDDGDK